MGSISTKSATSNVTISNHRVETWIAFQASSHKCFSNLSGKKGREERGEETKQKKKNSILKKKTQVQINNYLTALPLLKMVEEYSMEVDRIVRPKGRKKRRKDRLEPRVDMKINICVFGDNKVGKTSLITSFCKTGKTEPSPTVWSPVVYQMSVRGLLLECYFYENNGTKDQWFGPSLDMVVFLFDITDYSSFDHLHNCLQQFKTYVRIFQNNNKKNITEIAEFCFNNGLIYGGEVSCKNSRASSAQTILKDFLFRVVFQGKTTKCPHCYQYAIISELKKPKEQKIKKLKQRNSVYCNYEFPLETFFLIKTCTQKENEFKLFRFYLFIFTDILEELQTNESHKK
ncbi:hypothetical protein RFI_11076 [Reticulomyxa filosa]|uniref:Uncharacterized protein n=1 Tax=Reticulomyxa filosa TaxID=46433 RepID=X6NKZ8_RETFI|nr:hypothetical protein RFI_11076 [Reticulomyxa filosa]|eukprot:ETO26062.1 hypothetical protein RFI_11076 [Reticulomyxa filosa]